MLDGSPKLQALQGFFQAAFTNGIIAEFVIWVQIYPYLPFASAPESFQQTVRGAIKRIQYQLSSADGGLLAVHSRNHMTIFERIKTI